MSHRTIRPALSLLSSLALAAALLLPLAGTAQAQSRSPTPNDVSFQLAPSSLSSDDRSLRLLNYDRDFGNGWSLGGSLGYGPVRDASSSRGAFALLRIRHSFDELRQVPGLQPRIALEWGGGTTGGRSSIRDLLGVQLGVMFNLSPELYASADFWTGSGRFVVGSGIGSQQAARTNRESVNQVRLGLGFRY
jgi:hypothetical protein